MINGESCLIFTRSKFLYTTYSIQLHTFSINGKKYNKSLILMYSRSMLTNSFTLLTTTIQLTLILSLTKWEICSLPFPQRKPEKQLRLYSKLCSPEFRAVLLITRENMWISYNSIFRMNNLSIKFMRRLTIIFYLRMKILTTKTICLSSWNLMIAILR